MANTPEQQRLIDEAAADAALRPGETLEYAANVTPGAIARDASIRRKLRSLIAAELRAQSDAAAKAAARVTDDRAFAQRVTALADSEPDPARKALWVKLETAYPSPDGAAVALDASADAAPVKP